MSRAIMQETENTYHIPQCHLPNIRLKFSKSLSSRKTLGKTKANEEKDLIVKREGIKELEILLQINKLL